MGKIKKDSLGDRQKSYEKAGQTFLVPKMPIIIRIDGKAFHTYTRGMKKPFDEILCNAMRRTMEALCKDIQTCVFGYTQSDEITLLLVVNDRFKTQTYLGGKLFKIESLTASKATRYFNKFFREEVKKVRSQLFLKYRAYALDNEELMKDINNQYEADCFAEIYANEQLTGFDKIYSRRLDEAEFDARAFNVPEWDCINNLIWRQQDAIRNSVEAAGHANFSHKELDKVNVADLKQKLLVEKGIDWERDYTIYQQRGCCAYMVLKERVGRDGKITSRRKWVLDEEMPIIQDNREWFSELTGLKEE